MSAPKERYDTFAHSHHDTCMPRVIQTARMHLEKLACCIGCQMQFQYVLVRIGTESGSRKLWCFAGSI